MFRFRVFVIDIYLYLLRSPLRILSHLYMKYSQYTADQCNKYCMKYRTMRTHGCCRNNQLGKL